MLTRGFDAVREDGAVNGFGFEGIGSGSRSRSSIGGGSGGGRGFGASWSHGGRSLWKSYRCDVGLDRVATQYERENGKVKREANFVARWN
jgi:hypothetical protein